ncbi:hypothetical protein [Paracidovorax sp. MALMAid1276]|uniref:hypothetical protein n=1 Tax=Paracidovorax sp. MALMAid1276 TaxID=3411631 RepID=UPI003B99F24C
MTAAPAGVRCIRAAWIAALLTGSTTAAVTLGASLGTNGVDYVPSMWLDVALIATLGWGLYRRSRVAAALMLLYFAAAKVLAVRRDLQALDDPTWSDALESLDACAAGGWVVALAFTGVYALGLYGTVVYRKQQRQSLTPAIHPVHELHQK